MQHTHIRSQNLRDFLMRHKKKAAWLTISVFTDRDLLFLILMHLLHRLDDRLIDQVHEFCSL